MIRHSSPASPASLVAATLVALGGLAPAALAQEPTRHASHPLLVPGARIRVSLPAADSARRRGRVLPMSRIGTLSALDAGTLVLADSATGAVEPIQLGVVRRLEVSRGRGVVREHVRNGMLAGLLVGAAAGMLIASSSVECPPNSLCFEEDFAPIYGALFGGLGGVITGGMIGSAVKGERWQRVAVPGR